MWGKIRHWHSCNKGTAAIEFAMVGLPFIIMLVGMIEISLFFSSAVSLEGAANDAARLIRTGQVQASGDPEKLFEDQLCKQVTGLITCSDIQYQVIPVADNQFSNATAMQAEFDADGNLMNQGFDPGESSEAVLIRVIYHYPFLTPFLGRIITGGKATQALLMSTIVIKNEPYKFGG